MAKRDDDGVAIEPLKELVYLVNFYVAWAVLKDLCRALAYGVFGVL